MQEREKENSWLEAWEEGGDEEYKKGGKGSWKACCPSALSIFQQQHHQDPFLKSPKLLPGFCQENQNQDGRRQPVGDSDEYSPTPMMPPEKDAKGQGTWCLSPVGEGSSPAGRRQCSPVAAGSAPSCSRQPGSIAQSVSLDEPLTGPPAARQVFK